MKNFLAVMVLWMSVGSSLAQGRGPASVGAPTNIGTAHNPNSGNLPTKNVGSARSNAPTDSGKGASALDTGGFKNHGQYVAAQHIAENLSIPGGIDALRTLMTGDKAVSLGKAIQQLRPDLSNQSIDVEVKKAEAAAKKAQAETKKSQKATQ